MMHDNHVRETTHDPVWETPTGGGWLWLVAVFLAVVGLAAMARHGANPLVIVPVGISLFFMVLFLVNHRREARMVEDARRRRRLERSARRAMDPDDAPGDRAESFHAGPHAIGYAPPAPVRKPDTCARRIFDRFDARVIEHGRNEKLCPKEIASLLEFARDFVDVPHSAELLRDENERELERHLDAAIERALLQHAITTNKQEMPKPKTGYHSHYSDVPF